MIYNVSTIAHSDKFKDKMFNIFFRTRDFGLDSLITIYNLHITKKILLNKSMFTVTNYAKDFFLWEWVWTSVLDCTTILSVSISISYSLSVSWDIYENYWRWKNNFFIILTLDKFLKFYFKGEFEILALLCFESSP